MSLMHSPGVASVSVNAETNQVAVDFDSPGIQCDRIQSQLKKADCTIVESKSDS